MTVPVQPKLYHITHVDNLPAILAAGGLQSDAAMMAQGGPSASIGMSSIKQRRLGLPVRCHPGDHVGDYVPFYFCPRSIMLYLIYCANHPELTYRGGQGAILHFEAGRPGNRCRSRLVEQLGMRTEDPLPSTPSPGGSAPGLIRRRPRCRNGITLESIP